MRKAIERPELLRLAAEADVDPRTISRVLTGGRVRGRVRERIDRVLEARGMSPAPSGQTPTAMQGECA